MVFLHSESLGSFLYSLTSFGNNTCFALPSHVGVQFVFLAWLIALYQFKDLPEVALIMLKNTLLVAGSSGVSTRKGYWILSQSSCTSNDVNTACLCLNLPIEWRMWKKWAWIGFSRKVDISHEHNCRVIITDIHDKVKGSYILCLSVGNL